jgi:hypothetical protein
MSAQGPGRVLPMIAWRDATTGFKPDIEILVLQKPYQISQ